MHSYTCNAATASACVVWEQDVIWNKVEPLAPSAHITKSEYTQFFSRVYKCFHHPMNAEIDVRRYNAMPGKKQRPLRKFRAAPFELDDVMSAMLEQDWAKDSGGKDRMYFGAFHDAVFEVAGGCCTPLSLAV